MKPVFIIAEAGVNHNGSVATARRMVDAAVAARVDAIKFQMFNSEKLTSIIAPKAKYQRTKRKETQLEMLRKLELTQKEMTELFRYCRKKKILFMATPFDFESADFLNRLGMKLFKISSGDLNNIPFLLCIARFKKPVILSTGMSTMSEIRETFTALKSIRKKLTLLHCTSSYPTRFEEANLRAMDTLASAFHLPVGFSDHTLGIEASLAAVARGARVIEKHFTLDKSSEGPDHKASLNPCELKQMVEGIRNIEKALGSGKKTVQPSEKNTQQVARKSVVAGVLISKGTRIVSSMIELKRPGTGIQPKYFSQVVGKKAKKEILKDRLIHWSDLK